MDRAVRIEIDTRKLFKELERWRMQIMSVLPAAAHQETLDDKIYYVQSGDKLIPAVVQDVLDHHAAAVAEAARARGNDYNFNDIPGDMEDTDAVQ